MSAAEAIEGVATSQSRLTKVAWAEAMLSTDSTRYRESLTWHLASAARGALINGAALAYETLSSQLQALVRK